MYEFIDYVFLTAISLAAFALAALIGTYVLQLWGII